MKYPICLLIALLSSVCYPQDNKYEIRKITDMQIGSELPLFFLVNTEDGSIYKLKYNEAFRSVKDSSIYPEELAIKKLLSPGDIADADAIYDLIKKLNTDQNINEFSNLLAENKMEMEEFIALMDDVLLNPPSSIELEIKFKVLEEMWDKYKNDLANLNSKQASAFKELLRLD